MRRLHLFEIADQEWCPAAIRYGVTDFLQFMSTSADPYGPIASRLRAAIERTGARRIIDLCSGAGGPWMKLFDRIEEDPKTLVVCLTDQNPNVAAFDRLQGRFGSSVEFHSTPVDATKVPSGLEGFRTLFASFHHFDRDDARAILANAVAGRQGIAVVEGTQRSVPALLFMLLTPLVVLFATPFIVPFRWSRLFWTYVIPAIPFAVGFDGIVSCLRTYTPDELRQLVAGLDSRYTWEIGEEKVERSPLAITYLIGYPAET